MTRVTVVGSINMDIVTQVKRHPVPGETLKGNNTKYFPGGKGANQAVAVSRSGGTVHMIGAVGNDLFSGGLLESLRKDNININKIQQKRSTSGLAFITVDAHGENSIVLEAGANDLLTSEDILNSLTSIIESDVILLQNEIPWETTDFVIRNAHKFGIPVFLNPAPPLEEVIELFPLITGLILNETEAEILTGISVVDRESAIDAAENLIKRGVKKVIVTLGEQGCYYTDVSNNSFYMPGFKVNVLDTTAAGDTFIGAFAVAIYSGESIQSSLKFATAASAITVTKSGAQSSIPAREEIIEFLKSTDSKHFV